jgi:carboxymethylenebutenolidase
MSTVHRQNCHDCGIAKIESELTDGTVLLPLRAAAIPETTHWPPEQESSAWNCKCAWVKTLLLLTLVAATRLAIAQILPGTKTSFQTSQGAITIERFDPQDIGAHRAVMLVHGADGPAGGWRRSGMVEALTAEHYSVFVPHYFESGGAWGSTGHEAKFDSYLAALDETLRYIAEQPGIKDRWIGLVGFSLGGYLVLGLADQAHAGAPRIKAVVEFYGGMPDIAAGHRTAMPPVLILHGRLDDVVRVERAYELRKILDQRSVRYKIKVYAGEGHGFRGKAQQDANKRTLSFLGSF